MNFSQLSVLKSIENYVVEQLLSVDAGHDMSHINRVLTNARIINQEENGDAFLVEAGVLLHDVTDEKFFDKVAAEEKLQDFLKEQGMADDVVGQLLDIIRHVSFGNEFDCSVPLTLEQKIVRDADRLDAIGAIGIARTFHYGGSKNREIFNADIPPQCYQSTSEYRNSQGPTVNHFYEKLLLLKDRMETESGRKMAEKRHLFMLKYLEEFYDEIGEKGFH
jgi:uncharacterized protein